MALKDVEKKELTSVCRGGGYMRLHSATSMREQGHCGGTGCQLKVQRSYQLKLSASSLMCRNILKGRNLQLEVAIRNYIITVLANTVSTNTTNSAGTKDTDK